MPVSGEFNVAPGGRSSGGGTDGSQHTERGLPTPNLSTGEHNPHSPLESTCLEEMTAACEMLMELVKVWGERSAET